MKKLLPIVFIFCFFKGFTQEIHVENGIAYVDDTPYVKIVKKSKKTFYVFDLQRNEKIMEVKRAKLFIKHKLKNYPLARIYFLNLDKKTEFFNEKVVTEKDVANLLYRKNLILTKGSLNEELATEYHEVYPIGKRCAKIPEKDFGGILYHKYRPVIGTDTLKINEVKFECVTSASYTKKVMYDHFGPWTSDIYRTKDAYLPELLWKDVQLFEDDEKKFTVIARGLESYQTIYASIMVFDEKNYDMLDPNSPYRDKIVALFSDFIRNDKQSRAFYKAFWAKYDPKRWKEMQAYNARKNGKRSKKQNVVTPGTPNRNFNRN